MPVTIETVDVACTPNNAYALVSDPTRISAQSSSFKELRNFHGGKAQVGDQWVVVNEFMGRDIAANYTLLEADPPNKLVYQNESDSAEILVTWSFEPIDGGTRVTFHSDGEPKGFFASLALNLVKGNFDKGIRETLQNLKATLEG